SLSNWPLRFGGIFDLPGKTKRLDELNLQSENPAVWNKPEEMQKLNKERVLITKALDEWKGFSSKLEDSKVLLEMAIEAQDEESFKEVIRELDLCAELGKKLELQKVLAGEL
ncbi:MAG: PCRF domain-containing protein, partial [Bdellovibrionales bacterium]